MITAMAGCKSVVKYQYLDDLTNTKKLIDIFHVFASFNPTYKNIDATNWFFFYNEFGLSNKSCLLAQNILFIFSQIYT
jgi:hypothetical protein